ncbi:MAG: hypothetical protein DRJ52_03710 [Thermoprotei archaeon]|nr:MAG: hypothetical protein DRJ52_03710 [Thermoprotei archaeon]RLE99422.1 MAG: hypothetical protein DRJ63_05380 [Thermoprotei archaeon]HDI75117.1 stage II sporulation protein M [Thermoprotei archaeon]
MHRKALAVIVSLAILIVAFIAGAYTPLSKEYADFIMKVTAEKFKSILEADFPTMIIRIFTNNALICLLMFIPAAGAAIGAVAMYFTGMVISAMSIVSGNPRALILAHLYTAPHTWIEFAAYSLAVSESILFVVALIEKFLMKKEVNFKHSLKMLVLNIVVALVLLIIGAFVEAALIKYYTLA